MPSSFGHGEQATTGGLAGDLPAFCRFEMDDRTALGMAVVFIASSFFTGFLCFPPTLLLVFALMTGGRFIREALQIGTSLLAPQPKMSTLRESRSSVAPGSHAI